MTLITWYGNPVKTIAPALAQTQLSGTQLYSKAQNIIWLSVPVSESWSHCYRNSCNGGNSWWKLLKELNHCTSGPSELINGKWNKESIHFYSSSAPASRWRGWNSHSGNTLTCSLVSCHRQGKQEVGGCLRPLVTDKTPLPDLTAEAHWLIYCVTSGPVAIISNIHSVPAWMLKESHNLHTLTQC